jgi:O-methyltransferase involved in polyketide biosynthesis
MSSRPHLFLEQGDALSQDDMQRATVHFSMPQPLAIVHEGLMRYLTFEQKAQVAKNIKALLETYGGVYITPDITLKVFIDERMKKIFSNMVGMDVSANAFENIEAAEKFFDDLGFTVEKHPFTEIKDELVSPQRLGLSEEQVQEAIGTPIFFVMRLK